MHTCTVMSQVKFAQAQNRDIPFFFIDKIKSFIYEVTGKQVCLKNKTKQKKLHPW